MAEQQRAKSEIEAALTIAAARPRDQAAAVTRIVTSCQRPALAENSQYSYARGGTDISGPNIRLMEVIAQNWGNLEWGFRELARFPGKGGQPGESVVEAMAWDLESNSRVRKQFTVSHSERTKKGLKVFTDPRDIYEWIANQAQRRVRTALENIVPRDVQELACEECDRTLKAKVDLSPDAISKLVAAFEKVGVRRAQIEARIQRPVESVTPAQVIALRKIWASIRDGIGHVEDYFEAAAAVDSAKPQTAAEKAKEMLRKNTRSGTGKATQQNKDPGQAARDAREVASTGTGAVAGASAESPPVEPEAPVKTPDEPDPPADPQKELATFPEEVPPGDDVGQALYDQYIDEAGRAENLTALRALRQHAEANQQLLAFPAWLAKVVEAISRSEGVIKAARGGRSNR
jgi:hypothetical protein